MPSLPVISGRQCIVALQRIGYEQIRQKGSHVRLASAGRSPVTIPLHDELDRGTLRSIIRTVGLTPAELIALLDQ
jgi:predicted RNA binding protein YcfA (HicA-like mRNA interferase family)